VIQIKYFYCDNPAGCRLCGWFSLWQHNKHLYFRIYVFLLSSYKCEISVIVVSVRWNLRLICDLRGQFIGIWGSNICKGGMKISFNHEAFLHRGWRLELFILFLVVIFSFNKGIVFQLSLDEKFDILEYLNRFSTHNSMSQHAAPANFYSMLY
jgi:hypothetical protein